MLNQAHIENTFDAEVIRYFEKKTRNVYDFERVRMSLSASELPFETYSEMKIQGINDFEYNLEGRLA